jgi:hypothetical protein
MEGAHPLGDDPIEVTNLRDLPVDHYLTLVR